MAGVPHSYGPSCLLRVESNASTRQTEDNIPPVKPQFFYSSALPIDDPLSPLPSTGSNNTTAGPPRPFSAYDNAALEEAWAKLQTHQAEALESSQNETSKAKKRGRGHHGDHGKNEAGKGQKVHGYGPYCSETKLSKEKKSQPTIERDGASMSQEQSHAYGTSEPVHEADHTHTQGISTSLGHTGQSRGRTEQAHGHAKDGRGNTNHEHVQDERSHTQTSGNQGLNAEGEKHQPCCTGAIAENPHCGTELPDVQGSQVSGIGHGIPVQAQNLSATANPEVSHDTGATGTKRGIEAEMVELEIRGSSKHEILQDNDANTNPEIFNCDDNDHGRQGNKMPIDASGHRDYADDIVSDDIEHEAEQQSADVPTAQSLLPLRSDRDEDTRSHDTVTADQLPLQRKRHRSPFHRLHSNRKEETKSKHKDKSRSKSPHRRKSELVEDVDVIIQYSSSPAEKATTGTPFLRVPTRRKDVPTLGTNHDGADDVGNLVVSELEASTDGAEDGGQPDQLDGGTGRPTSQAHVPVGISRLHLVEMPDLQMKPIYWSPLHDVSSVVRATWFYKDTMLPVDPVIANLLERGFEYMRPWTRTYDDEVASCLEIGPDAELKLVHRLWPLDDQHDDLQGAIPFINQAAGMLASETVKLYAKSSVIYANVKDAQILRPNMLPSMARGRKPLGPIRKGRPIGIPVQRGFEHSAWDKLYPVKKGATTRKAEAGSAVSGTAATDNQRNTCPACLLAERRPPVTDLVLVIHGIGQKISERVESFHFTHAINGFRRQIAVELENEAVSPCLRDDLGGVMVLPINWRSTLTLEDKLPPSNVNSDQNDFTLKDITAETIPAVRSLISDILLDIPFYMSHHKPKMVEAVIREANRVYRLWCRNNPDFPEKGRIHLIAHSLGSVMALDILSKQPNRLPEGIRSKAVHGSMFEFETTNLFFCGSPAGFFLLLNHAPLVPRKARTKPGVQEEESIDVGGEVGTYGCLAVDNIYNVIHTNDPVAYRVNACVNVDYAASLQQANVPSSTLTWLQAFGSMFRSKPTVAPRKDNLEIHPTRPVAVKLPSTIELETHNFSREEVAERKMYLLNDNGQIDFFLSSGGGPLEIQYLNMLSAHSSYWTSQDFVRFLVVEIGRKPGRTETIAGIQATKKAWSKH